MRGVDSAATKIQAGFRGYRVRKQLRLTRLKGKKADTTPGHRAEDRGLEAPSRGVSLASGKSTSAAAAAVIGRESPASPSEEDRRKAAAGAPAASSPDSADDACTVPAEQLDRCATKIQAGVRGFLVRRKHFHQARAAATIQATFRAFRARREARLRAAAKL